MSRAADDRFTRLLAFADDVLAVCDALDIDPILDGSMAVKIHTRNASLEVRDIDLNCPEDQFPRLMAALKRAGIFRELQPWHVLQARRDDLKVEFGAIEVWLQGLSGSYESVDLRSRSVRMDLRDLYQRGFDATAESPDEREKHERIAAKLRLLDGG